MSRKTNNRPFIGMELLEGRRLMSAGTPVGGFGNSGFVDTHLAGSVYQQQVQTDGKILILSSGQNGIPQVTRFNADGSKDATYAVGGGDGNGILTPAGVPTCIALQSNNKLIVAGSKNGSLMVERYNTDGTIDTSYGNNGITTIKAMSYLATPDIESALSVIVDTAGRTVVLDEGHPGGGTRTALVRFGTGGAADTSFTDGAGHVGISFCAYFGPVSSGALAQAPDKSYVEMTSNGATRNGGYIYMERISDTGSFVAFNLEDIGSVFGVADSSVGSVTTLAITADNKIVFGGSVGGGFVNNIYKPGLAVVGRLNSSLQLDTTFNPGLGFEDLPFNGDQVSRVLPQANGKIIVAASGMTQNNGTFGVQRLKGNGTADTTFGNGGLANFRLYNQDGNADASLLGNGQILVAASTSNFTMAFETLTNDVGGISGTVKVGSNGLAGQIVYIDANNNNKLDTGEARTLTNASGRFNFVGLSAGTYKIRQSLQSNYTQSTPTNNVGINAAVTADQLNSGNNFTDILTTSSRLAASTFSSAQGNWADMLTNIGL